MGGQRGSYALVSGRLVSLKETRALVFAGLVPLGYRDADLWIYKDESFQRQRLEEEWASILTPYAVSPPPAASRSHNRPVKNIADA